MFFKVKGQKARVQCQDLKWGSIVRGVGQPHWLGCGLGIEQEESRSADILQRIPSQMRYSNIPLLISIGENLVFNNLSLGLNSILQQTQCVCVSGWGGEEGVIVFCCCFVFAFLAEPGGLWDLVPQPDIEPQPRDWTSALGRQNSPNHWIAREFWEACFASFILIGFILLLGLQKICAEIIPSTSILLPPNTPSFYF